MQPHIDHINASRISARILSLLLFALWGSFFVEQLSRYSTETVDTSPVYIRFGQGAHFLLLAGYLALLKWERFGSLLITVNAVLYFSVEAGTNAVPFIIVSLFPVMLLAYCWMKQPRTGRTVQYR